MEKFKKRLGNFAKGLFRSVPIVGNFAPYLAENKNDDYKPNKYSVSGLMGFFVGVLSIITLIAEINAVPVLDTFVEIIQIIIKFNTKFNINDLIR